MAETSSKKSLSLYYRLPIPVQNLACSYRGWQIERSRYRRGFPEALAAAEERAAWSEDRLAAYRDERLRSYVRHAADTVPYYRRLFAEGGVDPAAIGGLDDLAALPLLTKDTVLARYGELLSATVPKEAWISWHTGGTTGVGLHMTTTLPAVQEREAAYWRFRRWHGLDRGTWCGYFSAFESVPLSQDRPPFWRTNLPGRQIFLSTTHMSPQTMTHYAELLRRRRPPWLHGYPSALAIMAAHLRDTGFDLGYAPRWVTTGAESLLPQQRALVEEAFGVRPRQRYVMAEVVAGASECERGLLHLDEDLAATELLPAGGAGAFRVVGTNFTNLAMPLLRYETSDLVRPAAGPCGCGRPGRLLAAIDGRADDYIVTASGAVVGTSTAGNIALVDVDLREAQLVQERPGAIVFRVVPRRQLTESDEAALVASARKYLGTDMEVSVEEVASLPRTPSGKVRYIVSSVPGSRLADIGPSARDSADGAQ